MFTGLVEEIGQVVSVEEAGEGKRIEIQADKTLEDEEKGDSISVSGACLTFEKLAGDSGEFFLAEETLEKTWFSGIEVGDKVNLERSLKPEDRMGGHYVQGHVDATSRVEQLEELDEGWNMKFSTPQEVEKYLVEKGFVAVEGISLTIVEVDEDYFSITIIPETWQKTNLSEKKVGDKINIEADVMAKYAEKSVGRYS